MIMLGSGLGIAADKLEELYGKEKSANIEYVEALQVSEYERKPGKEELMELFPFFNQAEK